ncbi:MAG TPA: PEP-CTERM sorting domain-containing protein [Roseateles sp.]
MRLASSPVRSLLSAAAGALLALSSLSAHADFQSDITVKLIAPGGIVSDSTPISVSQLVNTASFATGIHPGDGGDVGGWMLANEEVTFVGNSIHVRSYAGDDGGGVLSTGYLGGGGDHARYEFDGLDIAGKIIVGVTVSVFDGYANSGFVGLANPPASSFVHLVDADTISLDLDSLLFVDRGSGTSTAHADFRIDLVTQDAASAPGGGKLPEPATLALFALAALGAGAARRRV